MSGLFAPSTAGVTANKIGDKMMQQIVLATCDEDELAEDAAERGMAGIVTDLNDELTVICGYASLGGEVSYDAERTEGYFALIETAGKKAAQMTRQLLVVDTARPSEVMHTKVVAWPAGQDAIDATSDSRPAASSFRRRLTSARALATRTGFPRPPA